MKKRSNSFEGIVLILLGTLLIGVSALMLFYSHQDKTNHGKPELPLVAFTVSPSPLSPLVTFSNDSEMPLKPLLLPDIEGNLFPAIDYIEHTDGSSEYILFTDSKSPATQVFTKTTTGAVTQRTNSTNIKFGLSVDKKTNTIAYLRAPADYRTDEKKVSGTAVAVSLVGNEERVLGPANAVSVMEGGEEFVLVAGKTFNLVTSNSAKIRELLSAPQSSLMAVDASSHTLAFVNRLTSNVDLFTFTSSSGASYVRSFPLNQTPHSLALYKSTPLVDSIISNESSVDFSIIFAGTTAARTVTFPEKLSYLPYRIVITHE